MAAERPQILIADDESNLRKVLAAQLGRDGCDVLQAEDGAAALVLLREHHVDLLITDLRMPKMDGMTLLRAALAEDSGLPVVVLTAHGTVDTAVEALKLGAFDFLTKPYDKDAVRSIVQKALKTRFLAGHDASKQEGPKSRFGIIGVSQQMLDLYAILERVADSPATVFVTGESGTGKELVARALHETSSRRDKPFIKVNCAAIPRDLIEAELFGHERGAFTGAIASKPGRFELANGGTLFLDEIGEVPVDMQVKLLRALQESEFERVGGIKTIRVDVRLVAATNRDVRKLVAQGGFREDLYYRLAVVNLRMPPLRERRADIPLLVEHFVHRSNERLGRKVVGPDADALDTLARHAWPGNIRELENVIERAVLFCDGDRIGLAELPPELLQATSEADSEAGVGVDAAGLGIAMGGEGGLKEHVRTAVSRLERDIVRRALDHTGGNVTHTARLLKISRKGLQLKMKELGLRDPNEKGDA